MTERPHAPATARNREPILQVLAETLADRRRVLEIGSGTGEHAVYFGAKLPWLTWQTSDLIENHAGINAWIDYAGGENVLRPIALDVRCAEVTESAYDVVFSANTAHIMGLTAVRAMFELAAMALAAGGCLILYGPFRVSGRFTSKSNRDFDASLRARDPEMGIRDLEALDRFAARGALRRGALHEMPANNLLAVWHKAA